MIKEYKGRWFAWAVSGIVWQTGSLILIFVIAANRANANTAIVVLGWLSLLGSTVSLIIRLGYYARVKGYAAVFGLLGLVSLLGVPMVALLPDKTKRKPAV